MHYLGLSIEDAILSPNFYYARQGDRCWRDTIWIYHHDPDSPSGVILASAGVAKDVDPLLRKYRGTSPLAPNER